MLCILGPPRPASSSRAVHFTAPLVKAERVGEPQHAVPFSKAKQVFFQLGLAIPLWFDHKSITFRGYTPYHTCHTERDEHQISFACHTLDP